MNDGAMPDSWLQSSEQFFEYGQVFFLLGSAAMVLILALLVVVVVQIIDLHKSVRRLTDRVQTLAERADETAKQVQDVVQSMTVRAKGITSMVDDSAHKALSLIDKAGPILLGLGIVFKLKALIDKKHSS